MSDAFEHAFLAAVDDLNHGRLHNDPDMYLRTVPAARHDEFTHRLSALMAARGPAADDEGHTESYAAAMAAVAAVKASGGSAGILPGALRQLRKARGIERDAIIDRLADEYEVGATGRDALRRYYHQLETGSLLGPKLSHRLLRSLARIFEADAEDFIAAVRPMISGAVSGGASPRPRLGLAPAMGRSANSDEPAGDARASGAPRGRTVGPDPDVERVEQLFCGGPAA